MEDTAEVSNTVMAGKMPETGPIPPGSSSNSAKSSEQVTFTYDDYPLHQEHSVPIDNKLTSKQMEDDHSYHSKLWWSRVRLHLKDPFAEFMGTFIMIVFGDGSVAQVLLSSNPTYQRAIRTRENINLYRGGEFAIATSLTVSSRVVFSRIWPTIEHAQAYRAMLEHIAQENILTLLLCFGTSITIYTPHSLSRRKY
jgi:hypothetical protein